MREVLVALDEDERRLAWTIVDGPYTHHNGVARVYARDDGRTLFEWRTDVLPDEAAAPTAEMMERGLEVARETQERAAQGTKAA